jgi:cell division protease FtsH
VEISSLLEKNITLLTVLFRTLTPGHDAVQKVTLVPRGQARGLTWFIPADDPTLISKQQLFARIVGGLGGRAAEEVIFGESEVTTGAAGDLQQVTGLAKQVTKHLK